MTRYAEDGYEILDCYACQGGGCPVCNGYGWIHGEKKIIEDD